MKTQRFLTVLVALAIALAYTSCKDEEGKNSSGDSFTSDNKEVNIDVSVTPNVPTGELVFAKITDFSKFDQTLVSGTTEGLKRTLVLKKESGTLKCGVVIGD